MTVRIPEKERIQGVRYAMTQQGIELPVIDVTHPSFAIDQSEAAMRALHERVSVDTLRWSRRPFWLRRLMLFCGMRRSVLLRGLGSIKGTFLSGMNTYLFKLSPENLASSFATPLDRRLAQGTGFMDVRLRLQITADLLAEKLCSDLDRAEAGRPVFLLNIAGGPAMDSLNALILAQRKPHSFLSPHAIQIAVLDVHDEGPHFGGNALEALKAPGGPLAGLNIRFTHQHYDWNQPESLRDVFRRLPSNAIGLGSSEGGLFHYATNEVIRINLEALREFSGRGFTFAGSLEPDVPTNRRSPIFTGAAIRRFQPDAFARLVHDAGWRIDRQVEIFRTLCFRLAKA